MARNHPKGWPGVPTKSRYATSPYGKLDDAARVWMDDALDLVTIGVDQRQAATDRHMLTFAFQRMEGGEQFAGSPFASISATTAASALGISLNTARASLARLSADGGPLVVLAKPGNGQRWGALYCPKYLLGKLSGGDGAA